METTPTTTAAHPSLSSELAAIAAALQQAHRTGYSVSVHTILRLQKEVEKLEELAYNSTVASQTNQD